MATHNQAYELLTSRFSVLKHVCGPCTEKYHSKKMKVEPKKDIKLGLNNSICIRISGPKYTH